MLGGASWYQGKEMALVEMEQGSKWKPRTSEYYALSTPPAPPGFNHTFFFDYFYLQLPFSSETLLYVKGMKQK